MSISNTPLTATEFEYLANNIVSQVQTVGVAEGLAQSGLHYVVLLQVDAPEVDLVNPFADQLTRMEGLTGTSNWREVANSLNYHGATRYAALMSIQTGTLSDKLNAYFTNAVGGPIQVYQTYSTLSALSGYTIDPGHVIPDP